MAHIPQVGMYQEERQICDPDTDLCADVVDVAGVKRLAVDAVVALPPLSSVAINDAGAGATEASVKTDGVAVLAGQGSLLIGGKDALGDQYSLLTDALGRLIVVTAAPTPGATVTSPADTPIGLGATVALPVPPVGTTRMTIQNSGPAGSLIRIREVGGAAGTGFILPRFASKTFDSGGAVAAMEAQDIAALATAALIQFEGP